MTSQAAIKSYYSNVNTAIRPAINNEYTVISRITQKLRAASEQSKANFSDLAEALSLNRRLWHNFGADVAEPTNGLPKELRAQIFYLAEFVDQHTSLVLAKKGDVSDLIEINDLIMEGLRAQRATI